ncbi:hypothetical protein [Geomonas propionica]|uniref:Uncharacterized protein n=1 Tax=Geomonas propionica TaxID=2798582 RepID=A0ABS0YTW0_9BACT|nr:hypothetical protein [Geomonas propionica]MBJ6801403.1 hypothetical protein [Geomonas propionica]
MDYSDSSQPGQALLQPQENACCNSAAGSAFHTPDLPPSADQGSSVHDLREEAANMLRLARAHEGGGTPLSISSRQARVVLGQF